jgi:ABC-type sugar transport system substrate-binding protein
MFNNVQGARRWLLVAAVSCLTLFGVAACGSNKDDNAKAGSGGVAKGEGIRAGTGSRAEIATADGTKAAAAAGGPVALGAPKTLGIINFLNGIESSDRLAATTKLAAKQLGWKTILCDGKGTPAQFVTCGNSLLDRKVDGIVDIAIEPGQIQPVLDKAKSAGVPVIQVGGGAIPNGDLNGNYGPDEAKAGQVLSAALLQKLAGVKKPNVIIHDFPAAWAKTRTDQLRTALKAQSTVKTTADVVTDGANLVQFTRKTVTDQLTQHPDVSAFWMSFDTVGQVGGQVVAAKYAGKQFPDRPLVVTFHADLGTLDLMRKGDIDFTSEVNYDAGVWIGIDNMAEFFARKRAMMQENQPSYPVVGDLFTYKIVDKSNLPPAGQYVEPKWDVPTYFGAKWKAEFKAS